jgi:hypothetical protein
MWDLAMSLTPTREEAWELVQPLSASKEVL